MHPTKTDFDVLVELTGQAMAAFISIDPQQEWSMEEIASMAVDQALETQRELKRRKRDYRQEKTGSGESVETGRETPVPGVSPGRNDTGLRGRMARKD
jgi:hypothetical protein